MMSLGKANRDQGVIGSWTLEGRKYLNFWCDGFCDRFPHNIYLKFVNENNKKNDEGIKYL